jgi:membrane protein DedA with SNARE-associated domain
MNYLKYKKFNNFIAPAVFPFSLCFFLLLFAALYRILNLPSPTELIIILEKLFSSYGFWIVFFCALIEGIFIIGLYFPGSLAIAISVLILGKTPLDLFFIGIISYFAFMISNILNYYLGKYGYYRLLLFIGKKDTIDKMQKVMGKYGNRTFYITGALPNFFAVTSVCAGISNLSIYRTLYLQATALFFWIFVWVIVGSLIVNHINLQDENQSFYIIIMVFLWGVYLIIKDYIKKKKIE